MTDEDGAIVGTPGRRRVLVVTVLGLAVAFVLYGALTLTVGKKHVTAQTEG